MHKPLPHQIEPYRQQDRVGWLLFVVVAAIAALAIVGVLLAALLLPYLQAQREAARRREIWENLQRRGTDFERRQAKAIEDAAQEAVAP